MPLRPPTRCCSRVAQIGPSSHGVYIALASPSDRFCNGSRRARQNSSWLPPGVLEHRKRLGKRRMTDLNSNQLQSGLPPWAVDTVPDLSKWNWEPPAKRPASDEAEMKSGVDRWLDELEQKLDKDNSDLASDLVPHSGGDATAIQVPPLAREEKMGHREPRPVAEADAETLVQLFESIDMSCRQHRQFEFYKLIQRRLAAAEISPTALRSHLQTVERVILERRLGRLATSQIIIGVLDNTIEAILSSTVTGPGRFPGAFWNWMLLRISSQLHGAAVSMLGRILQAVPKSYINDMSEGILANLHTILSQPDGTCLVRDAKLAHRMARKLAVALQAVSPEEDGALLAAADSAVRALAGAMPQHAEQLRFFWLSVLAQMPRVPEDYLFKAMDSTRAWTPSKRLQNRNIARLLIHQWNSRGSLAYPMRVKMLFHSALYGHRFGPTSIATLANALYLNLPERKALQMLGSMCRCWRSIGRYDAIIRSLRSWCETEKAIDTNLFVMIATASRDRGLDMELRHLTYMHESKLLTPLSTWRVTLRRLQRNYVVPGTSPAPRGAQSSTLRHRSVWRRSPGRDLRRKIRYFENMIVWFACHSDISNRIALRRVEGCIKYLRYLGVPLAPKVLKAVGHVVTRDLAKGERARTARLVWFLKLIRAYQGPRASLDTWEALRRWRGAVDYAGEKEAARFTAEKSAET